MGQGVGNGQGSGPLKQCVSPTPPATRPLPLTVVVAFDRAHEAEQLDDPAEAALHLLHEDTGQELGAGGGSASLRGCVGWGWGWRAGGRLTESMFLEMMTVTLYRMRQSHSTRRVCVSFCSREVPKSSR